VRRAALGQLLTAVAVMLGWLVFAPTSLGGGTTYVTTHGNSMEPRISQGDLVLVRESPTYEVGDSTAYWSDLLDTVVMHRIVAIEDGEYTFQGDNNSWLDPETPTEDKLIGNELLHIPQGGVWLDRLTSPVALALIAFGLLAAGGTTVSRRRRLRRRTVSQHAARTAQRSSRSLSGLPSWATTTAAAAGVVGILGVTLGFAAWTTSTEPVSPVVETSTSDSNQTMTFSYTAEVPKSPAYDDTTVTAPQPIFRKLTDDVEIEYTYQGEPGTVSVAAELSTASGWQSTVPLGSPKSFTEDTYTGTAALDLAALDRRAQAAAAATGIPVSQVDVKVVPTVTTSGEDDFAPELTLTLTPLQLTLAGDSSALTVEEGDAAVAEKATTPAAPSLGLAGREIPVSTARTLSLAMALGALLAAIVLGLMARASAHGTETAMIRRRYGQMLVKVQPMPSPDGRPVIDVVDFPTLAKLAERYELLILHWSRSNVDTFVVQDQATTYRYRTGTGAQLVTDELVAESVSTETAIGAERLS
jgi:signal peptidase I